MGADARHHSERGQEASTGRSQSSTVRLGLGSEAARLQREGKDIPAWMSRALKIANKLVFPKSARTFSRTLTHCCLGRLRRFTRRFAEIPLAIGMPLIEGYGLTEAGIVSFNPLGPPKPGSIGKILPGLEARLADDGELQLRGPCMFAGYYCTKRTRLVRGGGMTGSPSQGTFPKQLLRAIGTSQAAKRN